MHITNKDIPHRFRSIAIDEKDPTVLFCKETAVGAYGEGYWAIISTSIKTFEPMLNEAYEIYKSIALHRQGTFLRGDVFAINIVSNAIGDITGDDYSEENRQRLKDKMNFYTVAEAIRKRVGEALALVRQS